MKNIGEQENSITPNETRQKMVDEETLLEKILDAVAESRGTITVVRSNKQLREDGESFFCTFIVTVDKASHAALCAAAEKQDRSVVKLLRRYLITAFRLCIAADDEDAEAEMKAAA